jgi:predicted PurR-regulated permease PerM
VGVKARIVVAVLVGAGYAITYTLNGHLVPGLVGGVLAAVLLFLVVDRFERQTRARRERRR